MEVYAGEYFTVLIDGEPFECIAQVSLSESSDLVNIYQGSVDYRKSAINLQGWQVAISGYGLEGYAKIRGWFRAKQQVSFSLATNDGLIAQQGTAEVIDFNRTADTSEQDAFSATLLGVGPLLNVGEASFLLLENGDYLLQESGDRIII